MPQCYLVSEIAIECDDHGFQIKSDISVCGIFTTNKLANDAVLTWHERELKYGSYVPVGAGDFDSYKLSKPDGLLHLVACFGRNSWEVTVEKIEMNTEFTMSLLDPSLPEGDLHDPMADQARPPVKRNKVATEVKMDDGQDESKIVRRPRGRPRKIPAAPDDQKVQKLKLTRGGDRRSAAWAATAAKIKDANRRTSAPVLYTRADASSSSGSSGRASETEYRPYSADERARDRAPLEDGASSYHEESTAEKRSRTTPSRVPIELLMNDQGTSDDSDTLERKRKRKAKVEKELRQLQGWNSD